MSAEQREAVAASMGITSAQLAALGAMGGGGGGVPPGAVRVELTADEAAAVRRLMDLGFSQQQALEAYLSCDKNEEMAANFLFSDS